MISIKQIDLLRKAGYRVNVSACIVYDKKLFLLYSKKWKTWFLPQGGIENKEFIYDALYREIEEEAGKDIINKLIGKPILFMTDKTKMLEKQTRIYIETDDGKKVLRIGKYFLYFILYCKTDKIHLSGEEQFSKYRWADSKFLGQLSEQYTNPHLKDTLLKLTKRLKKEYIN